MIDSDVPKALGEHGQVVVVEKETLSHALTSSKLSGSDPQLTVIKIETHAAKGKATDATHAAKGKARR